MPNRGPHRLSRLSVHDLEKTAVFVVKMTGKITSSSFFSDPKMMGKNTSNEASCLFSKTLGMELMEP